MAAVAELLSGFVLLPRKGRHPGDAKHLRFGGRGGDMPLPPGETSGPAGMDIGDRGMDPEQEGLTVRRCDEAARPKLDSVEQRLKTPFRERAWS